MPSRREFGLALLRASLAAVAAAMPVHVTVEGWTPRLSPQSAVAKEGKGGGGQGGSKGDKGGGKDKGKDGGEGGGNAAGSASGGTNGKPAKNSSTSGGVQRFNRKTGAQIRINGTSIEVMHSNGMREKVHAGRYLMKDSKGRTIIERRATGADTARLRRMIG